MKDLTKRLTNLLTVKSLVTVLLTIVFCYLAVIGRITDENFMEVFLMIISFYFGTQVKKGDKIWEE